MGSRRQIPLAHEGRSVQASGMMRHGPFPGLGHSGARTMEPLPPPELLENKMVVQAGEIEQLAGDNHRLAANDVALRQDLSTAEQDIQRLKAHIRSIQTESDIQVRVLLDKIAKMEADVRAGSTIREELKQAHMEARSLVTARQELTTEIQQATEDLGKAQSDIKKLPELLSELENLRKEHQRLRNKFEYEKGLNLEKVEQLRGMEKNLVGMAREVEQLRAEVANAENRSRVPNPYGGPYVNPDPSYPPPVRAPGAYVDSYGRPVQMVVGANGEGIIPYGADGAPAPNGVWRGT